MGSKKHKKHHKSDKRERFQEIIDKPPEPLRLVLKVGGSSASEHGDSPHPEFYRDDKGLAKFLVEKHKKSKKRKKKKSSDREREKHERRHKHHHHHNEKKEKRKRDRDSTPDEGILDESTDLVHQPPLPKRILLDQDDMSGSAERPFREPRACTLKNRQTKSALQHLLESTLKNLESKDPQQFFAWPVTDNIAPGYSSIILHPMDFSTMRQKIDNNEYSCINDFKVDFKLMCDNAMVYNRPDTIYYKSAKRLFHVGIKFMSKEKLICLINTLPFMQELSSDELGFELDEVITGTGCVEVPSEETLTTMAAMATVTNDVVVQVVKEVIKPPKPPKPSKFEAIPDDITPEEILLQAQNAAKGAADRLTLRKPNSKLSFLRQNSDGSTSLNILGTTKQKEFDKRPITLEMVVGKITQGTGTLQTAKEDRRNIIKPVSYMNYGSYSSYAPNYDSMFSNLTKEESDLLYSTYGDEAGIQYAESILNFAKDCDFVTGMVDNLLDILTDGEHSKAMRVLEEKEAATAATAAASQLTVEKEGAAASSTKLFGDGNIDYNSLRSLSDIGIDVSFLDSFEKNAGSEKKPNENDKVQEKLDETTTLLQDLERVQTTRLSSKLPAHLSQVPCPSKEEMDLASKVSENLKELTKKANPSDVSSVTTLRKIMGISSEGLFDSKESENSDLIGRVEGDPNLVPNVIPTTSEAMTVSSVNVNELSAGKIANVKQHSGTLGGEDVEMPELSAEVEGVTDLESEIQKFLEEDEVVDELPPPLEPLNDGILG